MGSVQHHHHKINDTYHCRRAKQESIILVYNQDSYLMAEYSERTGRVSWQRVVPVTQREAVERWLNEQYPVQKAKAAGAATTAGKPAAKGAVPAKSVISAKTVVMAKPTIVSKGKTASAKK